MPTPSARSAPAVSTLFFCSSIFDASHDVFSFHFTSLPLFGTGIANGAIRDLEIPNSGGETCGSFASYAPTLDADEFFCTSVAAAAESLCCPGEEEAATSTEATDATTEATEVSTTADGEEAVSTTAAADDGSTVTAGTDSTAAADSTTAAATTTTAAACAVCAGGLTVDEGTNIPYPEANGATCGQLLGYAANQLEGSPICDEMKEAESVCCGSAATDPCAFCADRVVDEARDFGDGVSCGSLVTLALNVEAGSASCTNIQGAEDLCCGDTGASNNYIAYVLSFVQ